MVNVSPEHLQNPIQVPLGHLGEQGLVSNSLLVKNLAMPLSLENRNFPSSPQGTTRAISCCRVCCSQAAGQGGGTNAAGQTTPQSTRTVVRGVLQGPTAHQLSFSLELTSEM